MYVSCVCVRALSMGQSCNETMQSYIVVLNSQLVLYIGWNSGVIECCFWLGQSGAMHQKD